MTAAPRLSYDVESLKASLDGCDVFEHYVNLQGRSVAGGKQYPHPFEQQQTPSFTVYHGNRGFHDFKTGESGKDSLSLIAFLENLDLRRDFPRILEIAAGLAGITPDITLQPRVAPPKPKIMAEMPSQRWQGVMSQLVAEAESYLWQPEGSDALVWIRDRIAVGRDLPVDELIRSMRIGYLPIERRTDLRTVDGKPISVPSGILLPWFTQGGELNALQVRLRNGESYRSNERKYEFVRGSKPTASPYIAGSQFNPAAPTVITESVIKAAAVKAEYPAYNCVGMGSAAWNLSAIWVKAIRACPLVYLAMDNDTDTTSQNPGQEAQSRLATALNQSNIFRCQIPFGKDPDGFIRMGGKLANLFAAAVRYTPALIPDPLRALPDTWRAALNRYAPDSIAPTIELLSEAYAKGLIDPAQGFTTTQLKAVAEKLGRGCSAATIQRGCTEAVKRQFFAVLQTDISYKGDDLPDPNTICKTANKSPRGRPVRVFCATAEGVRKAILRAAHITLSEAMSEQMEVILGISAYDIDEALVDEKTESDLLHPDAELLAGEITLRHSGTIAAQPGHQERIDAVKSKVGRLEFQLRNWMSSPLPEGWTFQNSREYVACVLRAMTDAKRITDRRGNQTLAPGRERLAELIGVSPRNLGKVLQRAGMALCQQRSEVKVTQAAKLKALPQYDPVIGGMPLAIQFADGTTDAVHDPAVVAEALRRVSQGESVIVTYQHPSLLEVISQTQPVTTKPDGEPIKRIVRPVQSHAELPLPRGLRVLLQLLALVSSWRLINGQLQDTETGELTPLTGRTVVDLLCGKPAPPVDIEFMDGEQLNFVEPETIAETAQPSLIDMMLEPVSCAFLGCREW